MTAPLTLHRAPTGDAKGIDDVIERVQLMVEPVETALFNVFDSAHAGQWRALRARFYQDNDEVKASTVRSGGGRRGVGKGGGKGGRESGWWVCCCLTAVQGTAFPLHGTACLAPKHAMGAVTHSATRILWPTPP